MHTIDQVSKKPSLSESYGFIRTRDVLDTFESKGWKVVKTTEANVRNPERKGFQKHLIRLENPNLPDIPGLSENNNSRVQLCLLNSHDGTTSFRVFLGIIRVACLNGIIAGSSFRELKVFHSGNALKRLADGIDMVTENLPKLFDQIKVLQDSEFTEKQYAAMVKTAVDERLKHINNIVSIDYSSATEVRRDADKANDAYTMFNRLQESVIRGGINYRYWKKTVHKDGTIKFDLASRSTRKLSSINMQVNLNRKLFDLAIAA